MKKLFPILCLATAIACNSKDAETKTVEPTTKETAKPIEKTDNNTNLIPDKNNNKETNKVAAKDVKYYYKKYADVDSEDPAIGVGPRKILSEDLVAGIITYENVSNKEKSKIQVWNKNGYDIIHYPGGYLMIIGTKEIFLNGDNSILELVAKTFGQRTARGGECTYSDSPGFNISDKVEILLTCTDDEKFKDVIGYATVQNGKLVVVKK
jgi:hypothetical protein